MIRSHSSGDIVIPDEGWAAAHRRVPAARPGVWGVIQLPAAIVYVGTHVLVCVAWAIVGAT